MATPSDPRLIDTARLEAVLAEFARARDWDQYHTPRNLLLALTGEVGELAEIFQWQTDAQAEKQGHQRRHRRAAGGKTAKEQQRQQQTGPEHPEIARFDLDHH